MEKVGSSSSSRIRITGMATGMDTETMIKDMLSGERKKIDRVKQKQQNVKWQQEIYRDVIKDVKSLEEKYFSVTSPDSIRNSKAWNTLKIKSSNENIVSASGSAGANEVDYTINVKQKAKAYKMNFTKAENGVEIKKNSSLQSLGLTSEQKFSIKFADGDKGISKEITIRTQPLKRTGLDGKEIIDEPADTIYTLVKKINDSTEGEVKASYSEMTGKFTIENTKTGEKSNIEIVDSTGKKSDVLKFLGIANIEKPQNSEIEVMSKDKTLLKTLKEESNTFSIDGITYDVYGEGEVNLKSKEDVQPAIDNMKKFIEDYNKMMDRIYSLVTEKTSKDYKPLTEEQKKDMSEEEIKKWEKKAKSGLLRNDPEMRSFMDKMQNAIFGDKMEFLIKSGITSHENYNKKGQLALNEEKFKKALQNNGQKVYDVLAGNSDSVLEKMNSTIKRYIGSSSSIFAKKAGIEKTASVAKNFYSEQIKRQEDAIRLLQKKMDKKENRLYKQFSKLESSMNKLNSQMGYFAQM